MTSIAAERGCRGDRRRRSGTGRPPESSAPERCGERALALEPDLPAALRSYVWAILLFSLVLNALYLVSPLYMLQIYDRVLTSGSVETLLYLSAIAVFLLAVYAFAEAGRRQAMSRAGQLVGEALDGATLRRGLAAPDKRSSDAVAAVHNLAKVQTVLQQGLVAPLFDLCLAPLFIAVLFAIHWVLGTIALLGAIALVGLAVLTDRASRTAVTDGAVLEREAQNHLGHMIHQRAAIVSMGMTDRAIARWQDLRRAAVDRTVEGGTPATFLVASTRSLRQVLQVAMLGVGAALALQGSVTAGTIVAGSIIMGRALAPIDQTVASWRQLVVAAKAWSELKGWLGPKAPATSGPLHAPTPLPRPLPELRFEEFAVGSPTDGRPLLPRITAALPRGALVVLLGASGAGKTSLLQTIAGAWPPQNGAVRLGGSDLHAWEAVDRGRWVGYLPQHTDLLSGTIFQNVSRFTETDPDRVFAAARRVGCHEVILGLPQGYDTLVGQDGTYLSAGQRQAIGLARAFFGEPSLLLLDEPTAHLDAGLATRLLSQIARGTRLPQAERTTTAIIATHDLRLVHAADQVMLIQDRKVALMPREEYVRRSSDLRRGGQQGPTPGTARPEALTLAGGAA